MPYPQKHPLRAFTEQEEQVLSRITRADSERVDTVRRAKALVAVSTGVPFAEAARRSGFKSADSVSELVQRFNLKGLTALFIAAGRGPKPIYTSQERQHILEEVHRDPVVSLLTVERESEKNLDSKRKQAMEETKVISAGLCCFNENCPDYGQREKDNIRKTGKTEKGVQRYQCKTCKKTWTATKGTMFYRLRHSEEEVIECMEMVGDRNSLAAIHRMKGIKEETVCK